MPENLTDRADVLLAANTIEKTFWAKTSTWIGAVLIGAAGSILAYFFIESWKTRVSIPLSVLFVGVALCAGAFGWLLQYRRSHRVLKALKAHTGFVRLDESLRAGETPKDCMARATTSLCLMGIGGRKWSPDEEDLKNLLARLLRVHGSARFLLLNPESQAARDFSVMGGHDETWLGTSIKASLQQFKRLRDMGFSNLEVSLYNHHPFYRLVLIDGAVAIVSQYRGPAPGTGWDAPLVHFAQTGLFSFYQGFHVQFEHEWKVATKWDFGAVPQLMNPAGVPQLMVATSEAQSSIETPT